MRISVPGPLVIALCIHDGSVGRQCMLFFLFGQLNQGTGVCRILDAILSLTSGKANVFSILLPLFALAALSSSLSSVFVAFLTPH